MAPSSEIATIYRSNVAFSTEGKTALDVSDDGKVILERDLLTGNRIFIETTFTSIGRSESLEFRVFDGKNWSNEYTISNNELLAGISGADETATLTNIDVVDNDGNTAGIFEQNVANNDCVHTECGFHGQFDLQRR